MPRADTPYETIETLDQGWREACRADPIVSRGLQPPERSPLPRLVVEAVRRHEEGSSYFEREAPRSVDERLTAEEAMRQLSILEICHRHQLRGDAGALARLVEVVARGHEAVALMFIARRDEQVMRDQLTGLLNRRVYDPELCRAVEGVIRGRCTAILLNVDFNGFSVVNNMLGHHSGDHFLKHAAQLIDGVARSLGGQAYRIGGDEFVAIIRDVERQVVETAMRELQELAVCPPVSYGLCVAPDDIDEAIALSGGEESIARALSTLADSRMYEMKHASSPQERQQLTVAWLAERHIDL